MYYLILRGKCQKLRITYFYVITTSIPDVYRTNII